MNVAAMRWAGDQRPPHAADKLVLMGLAWHADLKTSRAWPSVAALCAFTMLKRKVVLASVTRLIAIGLVEDTGERQGKTKQVRVLRLLIRPRQSPIRGA